MASIHGNLLIGGMALRNLEAELRDDSQLTDSGDWLLVGRLHVDPQAEQQLQVGRKYRLQLDDGRAGPVVLEAIVPGEEESIAEFRPEPPATPAQADA